jgi:dTDP-4-amino-4,6-dideoxygalactose transaminase
VLGQEKLKKTKAILVNHEFDFPYENLSKLLNYELPIIENCAHSFISQNQEGTVGNIGDYVIYSLPKFFPIQFGGILLSNKNNIYQNMSSEEEKYIKKVLSNYVQDLKEIKTKRFLNYRYLEDKLKNF